MNRYDWAYFSLVLLFTSFSTYSQKLTIAVSSNAQYALNELISEFKKENSTTIHTVIGSSGKLTNQIIQGAPYSIFFSADTDYPDKLFKKGLTTKKPQTYASGLLVLWTFKNITLSKDLSFLKLKNIQKIAIANPSMAPYGKQALLALKRCSVYPDIQTKLIQGESVSQVNQYLASGMCDVGLTAKSVVVSTALRNKGKWIEVDTRLYHPIPQALVIIKNKNKDLEILCERFVNFVFSQKGKEILKRNGYLIPSS